MNEPDKETEKEILPRVPDATEEEVRELLKDIKSGAVSRNHESSCISS